MNKLLNFIVCSTVILALSSCSLFENEKSSKETTEARTIAEHPDSVTQKIVEQDARMTKLWNRVDSLKNELNDIKNENTELKEKVAELKSPENTWAYVSICAFILGLVALIVMKLFKRKEINEQEVYDIVKNCLDDSRRIKELQVHVMNLQSLQHNNKTPQSSSSYETNYDARLRQLESQMSQVVAVVNTNNSIGQPVAPPSINGPKPHREPECQKVRYAKNDKDIYFTTLYESNQEGCVFKISFTSPTIGKYNIISLDKIQSRNDWQQKVECSGISIEEASDFRVEDDGICVKINDNTWQVTKPLKIQLLK